MDSKLHLRIARIGEERKEVHVSSIIVILFPVDNVVFGLWFHSLTNCRLVYKGIWDGVGWVVDLYYLDLYYLIIF